MGTVLLGMFLSLEPGMRTREKSLRWLCLLERVRLAYCKLSRFVLKNLDNVPEIAKASRFLLENCPDLVKGLSKSDEFVAAMKKLGESDLGRLTKAEREALEESVLDET